MKNIKDTYFKKALSILFQQTNYFKDSSP